MSHTIPLGKKEGHRLEFKSAAALKAPETIARGVVAMLNADGGEVWVGLREENERAVAVEPIGEPDQAKRRLLDHLIDAIEPAPSKEIEVEPEASEDGFVLRIATQPSLSRRPYALLKGGGRQFLIRVGPRSRPMTREELQESFSEGSSTSQSRDEQALEEAKSRLLKAREQAQQAGDQRFWLGLEPTADLTLDLQDRKYEAYLQDPGITGNRRSGWSFIMPFGRPCLKKDRLSIEDERRDSLFITPKRDRHLILSRHGSLVVSAPLEALFWKGEASEIWPLALLEFPISTFRICREIYKNKLPTNSRVVADLSFFRVRGWKLRGGRFTLAGVSLFEDSDDLVWEKPLVFSAEEIENEPDRCGYRLVERVYEAFGFRREQMPAEFDVKSGRLILPE